MNKDTLQQLASQVKTPSYVYDLGEFEQRAHLVKEILGDTVNLCFSMKANPFLVGVLPEVFSNVEVCSPGELEICRKMNVDCQKVILSGVNKTKENIEAAFQYSVPTMTIESLKHASLIQECAKDTTVDVLVRVGKESQFGMDESEVFDLLQNREDYPNLNFVGIHYFTGTQKKKTKDMIGEIQYLEDLLKRIKETIGIELSKVEYGTGLAVEYFQEDGSQIEIERLKEIAPYLQDLAKKVHLTIEMGRFFSASCGYYFTKIMDLKKNGDISYVIVDGGIHQLKYDGQLMGMQIPPYEHLTNTSEEPTAWTICGSLCTTADVLVRNMMLSSPQEGDILVFQKCGAYSANEGIAFLLSRDLPQICFYTKEKQIQIVRDGIELYPFHVISM